MIDTLRGMYVSIPMPIRKLISPLLSLLPTGSKYGSTYNKYRDLIKCSQTDAGLVEQYWREELKDLINLAASQSEYYQKILVLPEIKFNNSDFDVADLLTKLPILEKNILRDQVDNLLVLPKRRLDMISTSGSSGRPLKFYLDKDRSVKEWAFVHHIWSKAGFSSDDKRAVLRGVHIASADKRAWEYDAALKELRLSPFHLTRDNISLFLSEIAKRKIKYFHGYPSALLQIAKHILKEDWAYCHNIKGIFPISESLFSHQRYDLKKAFPNAKILPFYGQSEKVAIASEIEDDVYEFEPTYGITELVKNNGTPIRKVGEKGRILSTGLLNRGMPLIRYDTEDEAELVQLPDKSNAYRLRVQNIRSRWGQEFVVGSKGELISIAAINIHSNAYAWVREFQFYQSREGIVDILIVPQEHFSTEKLNEFVKEIQQKVGSSITFTLKCVKKIERNTRGKTHFIKQKLDLSSYQ